MKTPVLAWFAVLLFCQQVFAVWAAHLVISPALLAPERKAGADSRFTAEAADLARGVLVVPAGQGRVAIAIEAAADEGAMGKGYYLVVSKKRLAGNALNLRSALSGSHQVDMKGGQVVVRRRAPEGFEEVRPLRTIKRNGETIVGCVLDAAHASRSYVVWDHKAIYDEGAIVMDGGLWVTYDIPAFVEASEKAKSPPAGAEEKPTRKKSK